MESDEQISYVATGNVIVVYYDLELKYLTGSVKTPCIISLTEWLNQGGE